MGIEITRAPSETPNITNTDDFMPIRYSYAAQNGYVKSRGDECGYTVTGSTFTIKSGRIVIDGVECDIDASGVSISVDSVGTKRYYTIYATVNLNSSTVSVSSVFGTATYPGKLHGDDLTEDTTGIANIVLYHFDALSGVISNVQKIITPMQYGLARITEDKGEQTSDSSTAAGQSLDFYNTNGFGVGGEGSTAGYFKLWVIVSGNEKGLYLVPSKTGAQGIGLSDKVLKNVFANEVMNSSGKGVFSSIASIEQRLTNLGFRQGSVSVASGTATVNTVTRQGNYVIGSVDIAFRGSSSGNVTIFTLPENFRPKQEFVAKYGFVTNTGSGYTNESATVTFYTNGEVKADTQYKKMSCNMNFGFEADPI